MGWVSTINLPLLIVEYIVRSILNDLLPLASNLPISDFGEPLVYGIHQKFLFCACGHPESPLDHVVSELIPNQTFL